MAMPAATTAALGERVAQSSNVAIGLTGGAAGHGLPPSSRSPHRRRSTVSTRRCDIRTRGSAPLGRVRRAARSAPSSHDDRLRGQRDLGADRLQGHVVDPEVAGGHQSEGRSGWLLLLDLGDVGQLRPAESPVLVEWDVLPVEHELGGHAVGAGADVEPAQDRRDPIPARVERDILDDPNLGSGTAKQEARVLPRAGHLPDPGRAVALVVPSAPLREDQSELVFLLGDLEGRVFEEIPVSLPVGKARWDQDHHREQRRMDEFRILRRSLAVAQW